MATAAVTRCGFQGGKGFEGCEERVWERRGGREMWKHSFTEAATETTRTPAGCRAQQTCRQLAESRQVGERHGRKAPVFGNTTPKMTPRGSRDRTRAADVGGGAFFGKPQERKFGRESRQSEPARGDRKDSSKGPHNDHVSEGEVKERGLSKDEIIRRRLGPGRPRRSGVQRPRPRSKQKCQVTCPGKRNGEQQHPGVGREPAA